MNRSYSCIGKITRFLSFISIRTKSSAGWIAPFVYYFVFHKLAFIQVPATTSLPRCRDLARFDFSRLGAWRIRPVLQWARGQAQINGLGALFAKTLSSLIRAIHRPLRPYPSFKTITRTVYRLVLDRWVEHERWILLRFELGMNSPLFVPNLSLCCSIGNQGRINNTITIRYSLPDWATDFRDFLG